MKAQIIFTILIVSIVCFSGCAPKTPPVQKKIGIVVTIAPLRDFAEAVGGDQVDVTRLLPVGADPHSWEPRPSDIEAISNADIFIYIGGGLEPWTGSLPDLGNKTVIDASSIADIIDSQSVEDPHLWLDIGNDEKIIDVITEELSIKSPENSAVFQKNSDDYKKKLKEMDDKYRIGLNNCKFNEFIVGGHSAFGYVAHRYGLTQVAVEGIVPEAEPGAHEIARLVNTINRTGIRYVLYESTESSKIADVLAADTGAKAIPMQTGVSGSTTFLQVLDDNLKTLRTALGCQ